MGLQQGLSLTITAPKISAGMWLIDAQMDSDASGAAQKVRSEV
jgi:hypothetical protein